MEFQKNFLRRLVSSVHYQATKFSVLDFEIGYKELTGIVSLRSARWLCYQINEYWWYYPAVLGKIESGITSLYHREQVCLSHVPGTLFKLTFLLPFKTQELALPYKFKFSVILGICSAYFPSTNRHFPDHLGSFVMVYQEITLIIWCLCSYYS